MELRQLEYFVAVVEEANFTRAAARLHVAQPGVSAQVRRLEREFGEDLLDRSGRAVRLTEVGEAVLPHARAALRAVADARVAADEVSGLVRGRVAVGMVASTSSHDLPDMLADFHREYPGVEITLSEDASSRLLSAVRNGRLDAALVGTAGEAPPDIETQTVADQPLVAAVGHDDPLAKMESIPLETLVERSLACLPRGTGLRALIEDACADAGLRPHVAFEASDPDVLAMLAGRGLGVAVLAQSTARDYPRQLHAIPITGPKMRGRLEFAWRSKGPISPASRALIGHARARWPTPRDEEI